MFMTQGRVPESQPFEQHPTQPAAAGSPSHREVEVPGERLARILVVDDNVDLARGLARLLEIRGHDVQVAYDGPTGLDKAKKSKPEVVLLDIGLPGMDGYQVAAHLRQEETVKDATLDRHLRLWTGGRLAAGEGGRLRSPPRQAHRFGRSLQAARGIGIMSATDGGGGRRAEEWICASC